ncbi:cucumber peeling cupredoxin-like [Panicum virgatum]|uniref:Phytocyanin domain-containing protein n=1 Tax=Panicum virgatum TaxID=38727 RepID=A0A8T0VB30_PANVG|nr:cucumber peeling cupredoxin-like [Panicum virgatum]KAG2629089.1 hypothetical protein PVAP13_3KG400701 [Panicum virgatum]
MARLPRLPAAAAFAVAVLLSAAALPAARAASPAADDAPEYRNHTVGGADGWFFDARTNATSGNYSGWANGETFYLGDYLIFKTNDNSSVVHTTNATTYDLCDPSDDLSPVTYIYGGGGGLEENTIPVPLVEEGANYFFSDADGGAQCQQGMRFEVKVEHGQGLPPSLKNPPPAPKERVLAPPPAGTAFSGTGGVEPGDGAGDNGGAGRSGACRAAAAGGRFLGAAVAVALAALVAA